MIEIVPAHRCDCPSGAGGNRCLRALALAAALSVAAAAHAKCIMQPLPDIPVTMEGAVPMVHAQINGSDALFIADSGAFFSVVTPSAAAQFHMKRDLRYANDGVIVGGGYQAAQVVKAKSFTIMGFTVPNADFIVSELRLGRASGVLGQNLFRLADVEYDLANGIVRLVQPQDCKNAVLAYWAPAANKPFSVIDIELATPWQPHTVGAAYLNGTKIRVLFNTGAQHSMLTLAAAERAGVTPKSAGVEARSTLNSGNRSVPIWIARFASFKLGEEQIDDVRLLFGDVNLSADMVIGADFFLAHRIYVASSQRKLYFTYNGGPVFEHQPTREVPAPAAAGAAPAPGAGEAANAQPAPPADRRLDEPTDASGFARRGAASAARRDYGAAIADLTRACELAPAEASYFYQRGMAHWSNRQPELALTDFDQAIKLKPDDVPSLLARATFKAGRHDAAGATADLQDADRATARDSDERLRIALLYESLDNPVAARAQSLNWIDTHPRSDPRMAGVLGSRCWEGALSGQALDEALADCNAALKIAPKTASYLGSRGLVYLRLGNYGQAIADYDAALRMNPKSAWSLFGRGLARLQEGDSVSGQADLAAATALNPKISERAARFGLTP